MADATDKKPIDKWIPWFVVLFFLCFMSVDAVMVTLAVKTQTGVITENAYEKGLTYNRAIDAAENQKSWGWTHKLSLTDRHLSFMLNNDEGRPIDQAIVRAKIIRPIQDGQDFEIQLSLTPNSTYEADIPFPQAGLWTIRIYATWMDKQYQASQDFLVRQ